MKLSLSALVLVITSSAVSSSARPITNAEIKAKSTLGFHLLSLAEGAEPVWKSNVETDALIAKGVKFFDVTEVYSLTDATSVSKQSLAAAAVYAAPSHQTELAPILATVSLTSMQNYLNNLTAFTNRYYNSDTGKAASVWIRDTMGNLTTKYPTSGASVSLFTHSWKQSSIIAKIPGKTNGPITILGAHMDSIGTGTVTTSRAPGADDDGSGSANLMEAFRVLLASGFQPTNPVEFHWYSGEEGGLKGSQAIATNYKAAAKSVKAMLQLDMTAYVKPGTTPVISLMPDYTDSNLNAFVGSIITAYTTTLWKTNDECGYACSDHASWNAQGYPTALPFEGMFADINPKIHSSADTTSVSGFSWTHSLEYVRLAVGFAYELAI